MDLKQGGEDKLVRVSMGWFLTGAIIVVGFGVVGGLLSQWFLQPNLPPLTEQGDRLITTIQEVTISPGIAAGQMVADSERSVVLLAPRQVQDKPGEVFATGLIVTSDGLVVAPTVATEAELMALDFEGRAIALDKVGDDSLYGLSYWRMTSGVFVPLEIRDEEAPVASQLIALSRQVNSLEAQVRPYTIEQYRLGESAPGVQRVIQGSAIDDQLFTGAPLLDDEGRVAALFTGRDNSALPARELRASLNRIINGQQERDPLAELGLTVAFEFSAIEDMRIFTPTVISIQSNSPAALAGVRPGDIIRQINGEDVDWRADVVEALGLALPIQLNILRGGERHVLTLHET